MASKHMIIVFVVVAAVLPAVTLAKEFIVGDDSGWTIGFDYQAWAAGKEFRVRDKLVFNYPVGAHDVRQVNGTGFQDCIVSAETEVLVTGKDVITLSTAGRKWYICGVGKHCEVGGQKLAITVLPELAAPAPSPQGPASPSAANGIATSGLQVLVAVVVVITMMSMA